MAMNNYLEGDCDLNWLQFLANHQMQTMLLMEDDSSTALLGLPPNLFEETTQSGGSEIFGATEDANVILARDLQNVPQQQKHSAMTNLQTVSCRISRNLAENKPATCVSPAFPSDPLFAERAAKYSPFLKEICQKAEESTAEAVTNGNNKQRIFESALSGNDAKYSRLKKRKAVQKTGSSEAPKIKRLKSLKRKAEQSNNDNCAEKTEKANNLKAPPAQSENPNYIHVRARRGEATDSHSLAERVRREKISKRMKILQDLVPGCSKITGKALLLDEIINHVQWLQRQVEFLSMKLATLNPCYDFDNDNFCAKDIMTHYTPHDRTSWHYLHHQL